MKILLLSNKVPYPARDGSSIAIKSIIESLLMAGADVSLLSINTHKHFKHKDEIRPHLPPNLHFQSITVDTGIRPGNTLLNLFKEEAFHVSRFYNERYSRALKNLLTRHDFDLIQLEGVAMGVYLADIRKYSRAKISYRAHNVEYRIWERQSESERNILKKRYLHLQCRRLEKFERLLLEKVDLLIPISTEDFRQLQMMKNDLPACVIPYGRPLTPPPGEQEAVTDIVYLASYDWLPNLKGLQWFLEKVWPLIKEQQPDCQMRLGGKNLPLSMARHLPEGISYQSEVITADDFIRSGKVLIVPLLAGSGIRIKIIDNMALGKAMVSTSIGAEGIEVRERENIIIADEEAEFAEAVIKLLSDAALRTHLETEARKTVEKHYNPAVLGEKLLNFYRTNL